MILKHPNPISLFSGLILFAVSLVQIGSAEENWPSYRGPQGDGHARETGLPTEWGTADVAWSTPLPGEGQSCPTIWGERIYMTASLRRGEERVVFCVNRNDGRILWQKTAWTGRPEPTHKMTGWASATCATNGKYVYAFFGHGGGLFCYTTDGDLVWNQKLGNFEGPWGTAASPILYKNLVIQNCDADVNAAIAAFDQETGDQVWRTKRENYRGWSTPVLVDVKGKKELVLNGHLGVRGYDPDTGNELWFCRGYNGRGTPMVTPGANGLLHVICGRGGDAFAIRPGGRGDVTATHRVWHTPRLRGRDLPSPIVLDGQMLVANMAGILSSYNSDNGKNLWRGRLGGNYSAAPLAYQGLAFFLSEDGRTVAVKPGPQMEIVTENLLKPAAEEVFRSTPTPSDGQIFIRSTRRLYCIGERNQDAS
ncbi:outer membrane protein assembly factor BamB family protein [Thalassoroseus pseudoceratinae]|uniref:outer membrane protein assembly factor BamB family protein n=1 Tax=Thalassoroseus pseudoceratinae TaxID=2713176 RepID=UPI0014242D79|nr:PQQ-binding-like beta-propeller repeat protein [Thalassoroseus pseudoceratinae]